VIDQQPAGLEGFTEPNAPCRSLVIPASLVDRAGRWTLTIHEFHITETAEALSGELGLHYRR
jgi:hypothetical protein